MSEQYPYGPRTEPVLEERGDDKKWLWLLLLMLLNTILTAIVLWRVYDLSVVD